MAIFKKDKNAGLNEAQRLAKAQFEKEQEETNKRFQENLGGFRKEYDDLVMRWGIFHLIAWKYDKLAGPQPYITEADCWAKAQEEKKRRSTIIKDEGNGIVKS